MSPVFRGGGDTGDQSLESTPDIRLVVQVVVPNGDVIFENRAGIFPARCEE